VKSEFVFRRLLLVALIVTVVVSAGCLRGGQDIPASVQQTVDMMTEEFNSGKYDTIYRESSSEWQTGASLEESNATFKKLKTQLGSVKGRVLQTARDQETATGAVPVHSFVLVYETTFDHGDGMETFTLTERGAEWQLARYNVSSAALQGK
jgi:hypothetical protein